MKVAIDFNAWQSEELCIGFLNFIGVEIPQKMIENEQVFELAFKYMDNRKPTDPQVLEFLEGWIKDHPEYSYMVADVHEGLSWSIREDNGRDYVHTFLEVTQEELLVGLSQEKVNLLRYCHGRIEVKGFFPILR